VKEERKTETRRLIDAFGALPFKRKVTLPWRLFRDPRTPWPARLLMPGLALYLATPIDIIPDFIPVIGYLDDLLVVLLVLKIFSRLCPKAVLYEHLGLT